MLKKGFANTLYKEKQTACILQKKQEFNNKLYIEYGGKIFDDFHAARVLPGFNPNVKADILQGLKDQIEVIFCIGAPDIEKNKMRAEFGISYADELIRLIRIFERRKIAINSVVITQYADQISADVYKKQLERMGYVVYVHKYTKGYPHDINVVVSDIGYGANSYITTSKPIVVVCAPGPKSGKLATCLSQLYHEHKRGVKAGYAKFETFPIWNLPLNHPVNIAYEAATVDIDDRNMIDHYHLEAYGVSAVNYNRDLGVFPVARAILQKIMGSDVYKSPTDMSINMVADAITDEAAVINAAKQEIIRRYFRSKSEYRLGRIELDSANRIEMLMKYLNITTKDRKVVDVAIEASHKSKVPAIALELPDGTIVTGKDKMAINAAASVMMNAVKTLAKIDDEIKLISPMAIDTIQKLKVETLKSTSSRLSLEEALVALAFSSASNPTVKLAMDQVEKLSGCEAHSTIMIPDSELQLFYRIGINITCEPVFALN